MTIALPDQVLAALRNARRLTVLTGAGISAESGVPTFRDAQTGLWSQYEPTQLATAQAFRSNPKLVWDWYQWRRDLVLSEALGAPDVSMQLDNASAAGLLMQAVHVLRDEREAHSRLRKA